MDISSSSRRVTRRTIPLLLAGIIGGAALLTPAVGSAAAFLTKAKGDKRYLNNSSIVATTQAFGADQGGTMSVNCPAGRQALSGGADSPGNLVNGDGILLMETRPISGGTRSIGWYVEFFTGSSGATVTIHAVCAP
jgi:hypothetical protein